MTSKLNVIKSNFIDIAGHIYLYLTSTYGSYRIALLFFPQFENLLIAKIIIAVSMIVHSYQLVNLYCEINASRIN